MYVQQEITSIAKKRSDFEHKLNARGSHPSDYARYAEYESNLESLRRKRMKRLGLKKPGHAGQRRIFFVLDRATKKFQGDLGLWMQYIEFNRKQKANKKLSQILTDVLRLHPTKPELWIYAAKYALEENSDITEARSYTQRALRFCKHSKNLWLEYAKLEMIYISRIAARGRILGLNDSNRTDADDDMQRLPAITDMDQDAGFDQPVDKDVLTELNNIPALSGAIPIAIYDAAMNQFNGDSSLGQQFFDHFASFGDVPCMAKILNHVVDDLRDRSPSAPPTLLCYIQQPTAGVEITSAEFPTAISLSLDRIRLSLDVLSTAWGKKVARPRSILAHRVLEMILHFLSADDIDPDVALVLSATLRKTLIQYLADLEDEPGISSDDFRGLLAQLEARKFGKLATSARLVGARVWPKDERFLA